MRKGVQYTKVYKILLYTSKKDIRNRNGYKYYSWENSVLDKSQFSQFNSQDLCNLKSQTEFF